MAYCTHCIRSAGRDGVFQSSLDDVEAWTFLATDYDQDIVWADGHFVKYPQAYSRAP